MPCSRGHTDGQQEQQQDAGAEAAAPPNRGGGAWQQHARARPPAAPRPARDHLPHKLVRLLLLAALLKHAVDCSRGSTQQTSDAGRAPGMACLAHRRHLHTRPPQPTAVQQLAIHCGTQQHPPASPIISLVISMRSFCFSNSRMILATAGRFMRRFIWPIALVAPAIASPMACVDLSVCRRAAGGGSGAVDGTQRTAEASVGGVQPRRSCLAACAACGDSSVISVILEICFAPH